MLYIPIHQYDDDVGCDGNRAWNHDDEEAEEDEDDHRRRPRREASADDDGAAEAGVKRVMVSDSRENSKMARIDPKSKSLPQGVCHGFLRGNCTRGASCRFPHILDPSSNRRDKYALLVLFHSILRFMFRYRWRLISSKLFPTAMGRPARWIWYAYEHWHEHGIRRRSRVPCDGSTNDVDDEYGSLHDGHDGMLLILSS
jgi:hypothetical protein